MVKGQVAKKNKKVTQSSRNVKKKTKEITTLSSEELLEQILNKKHEKQVKKSASVSSAKKSTDRKTTVKKTVKKETTDSALLLEQILEKNKAKKQKRVERKKKKTSGRLLVDSNTVENKIVQEIIRLQEEEQKKKEESLIITKEINLKEYLEEQNELPPREDFLELESELYPTPKSKKDEVKKKIEYLKKERKAKRTSKYEKEIEKKLERRRKKEEQATLVKKPKRKPQKKSKVEYKYSKSILPGILVAVACLILIFSVSVLLLNKTSSAVQLDTIDVSSSVDLAASKAMQEICLDTAYSTSENNEEINVYINELNGLLSKYNVSVYYYDLNKGFNYSYKVDDTYYAASIVKVIPALYVYEKAAKGEIDLDKTLTYNANYNYDNSAYFDSTRFGTKVSLRNVIKYSLIYSDNSAYMMLVDYIGSNTLKEYAKAMGVNSYMDTDKFGHIKAQEAINIIKKTNELLSLNTSLTNELKGYMIESDKNYLGFEDKGIKAATKYGESYPNYHEIGIVYDENPYGIVILTRDMGKDYEKEIKEISSKIYELHRKYYTNRINNCEKTK